MKLKPRIKHFLFLSFFCLLNLLSPGQDYLTGKVVDKKGNEKQIFYDRTQLLLSKGVYQTVYKVLDGGKNPIYSILATNDRAKSTISISIKAQGTAALNNVIRYDRGRSGLILSDRGALDTAFDIVQPYSYLLSFTDTMREYPILHKLRTKEGLDLILDPVTKLRLRKHNELVRFLVMNNPELKRQALDKEMQAKKEAEMFDAYLLRLRDSLYTRNALLAEHVTQTRNTIEKDIATLFKAKKVYPDARRYEGEKKDGLGEGKGLFMANGNYYDGLFSEGKFISGVVIIHYDAYEYCGDYSQDSLNGIGWLKYKNESYLLGTFREGTLQNGVTLNIGRNGEVFFGTIKNSERTGYAEMHNTKGEMYYGEFLNGVLVKGYSKDADPFGFFIYSKIDNGIKTSVDIKRGEAFFNPLMSAKP